MHAVGASTATASRSIHLFAPHTFAFVLLSALVAGELAAAAIAGPHYLGEPIRHIFAIGNISLGLAGWLLIPLVWLAFVVISLMRRRSDRPTKSMLRLVRLNRAWLTRGFLLSVIHIPLGQSFATLKSSIPAINPFGWDHAFAQMDRSILGMDAWRITHSIFGDTGTIVIDRIYALWGIYLVLLAGWISFTRLRAVQIKAALTFNLSWLVLGTVLATVFASAGPCFVSDIHGDTTFDPLMSELKHGAGTHGLLSLRAMEYLIENSGTARLGAGISAMPSMHMSMATLGVIVAFAARARAWIKGVLIAFALTIMIGAVHLGWHYAVDGIASVVLTLAVWFFCSAIVEATRSDVSFHSKFRLLR